MIHLTHKKKNEKSELKFSGDLFIELYEKEGYDESFVYEIMDKCDATKGVIYEDEEIKVEICE